MMHVHRRAVLSGLMLPLVVLGRAEARDPMSDVQAPFGLVWDASPDDVRKLGVVLVAQKKSTEYGAAFVASQLPKIISDIETVIVWFGYENRLWRIGAIGKSMGPDPYGNQLIARYNELSSALQGRYGRGKEVNIRDTEIWTRPSEYLSSLEQGRASRYTSFDSGSTNAELSIRASSSDEGFYVILFEYKPGAKQFREDKEKHEKDAL